MFLYNSASVVKTREPEDEQLCFTVIYNIEYT